MSHLPTPTASEEHFTALGRLIVSFQSLEGTLVHGLVLLATSQVGTPGGHLVYAVMNELSFGTVLRLAGAVPSMFTEQRILDLSENEKSQVLVLLEQCSKKLLEGVKIATALEQRRNQLIHSKWFISPEVLNKPGTMTRMKAKTRNGTSTVSFDTESIEDIEAGTRTAKAAQLLISDALAQYQSISQNYFTPRNAA